MMKDRIQAFLQNENKSYAQFADEIGVQASGISHILSGRNNPSLDFVIKMLHRYSSLSAEWLLFGRGPMYNTVSQPTLFGDDMPPDGSGEETRNGLTDSMQAVFETSESSEMTSEGEVGHSEPSELSTRRITRIIMFYSDKTFTEYLPT
ncbi:MAG: helix-turn-helix transcriptional regulator [Bacteroidales bacterium]|jgi:transcriptional regulator with XRE-family HTH domain|nr:helix-turn-helix transcriptional regulator [Bacteroidales bacterium]MDD3736608.1 helix-turn-helix transcriptional regulator [Bacteroidales bacterium]NLD64406.1 helix-turn-helix transcriptional regulator [Bacteroidales bacterium]HNT93540.1 helix-turn-helix transcriptional regulator [Bacteroidales bacterium]HPJ06264.1 helix-turn-helix transcriptional regulator [Bacteroidales bacterium]